MRPFPGVLLSALALLVGLLADVPDGAAATQPPTITQVWTFGYSAKGLPLRGYRLGEVSSPNVAVIIATMHGDESGPARILKRLMSGPPVRGGIVWVVPDLNPDGYVRGTRKNARGVDLNRNFPVDWVYRTGTYYSGPKPASEPETRAAMRFLNTVKPTSMISLHQPLYGVDTSYPKTRSLALRLVDLLELPGKVFTCGSGCHGTMTQWFNARFPGAGLTVEYGRPMTDRQVYITGPSGLLQAVNTHY